MSRNKSRTVSEVFKAVAPKGYGIPPAPTIAEGVSSSGDLSGALSSVGQQIQRLQGAYQSQVAEIQANTAALTSNTASKSAASTAAGAVSSVFGGGGLLGLLDPIGSLVKGISSLFSSPKSPAPLPIYVPPPPVSISGALSTAAPSSAAPPGSSSAGSSAPTAVNVTVTAMDSQSFMDHSAEIANAVREAMLNMHPINGVVRSL